MTKKTQLRFGLAVLLGLSLSGCFKSNPPVKTERYSLPEVTTPQAATTQTPTLTRTLALGRLQLADYLDTDRIIIQTDDITMQPARDHLWVDNLSQELRRGLRARLASRLGNTLVVDPQPGLPATNTLHLTIEQFHGQMRGYAVLSGQWQLISANQVPGPSRAFKFSTPLAENGYPALVRALGQDLDLLSEQIASQLQTLP
ncbi:membrane integrity-associated transporter subunit PqiC [Methylophilus sp. 14]|uniref:PqiC family protein n=1 Tax=Methylophilus sp. 14 TaxID=2781019 RepID=UPI001E481F09|nr:ABC-type transport auxiliary lipoprotein family protein [Methylophilus sp. 14]